MIDGSRWRITRVLREHAESIIRAENQLLSVFLNSFLGQYETNLTTLKQISGASHDEAQVKFTSGGALRVARKAGDVFPGIGPGHHVKLDRHPLRAFVAADTGPYTPVAWFRSRSQPLRLRYM